MATSYAIAAASGNWDASVWAVVINTPTMHASTNLSSASTRYTAAFTSPHASAKADDVLIFFTAKPTSGTLTITLQQNSAGWVDMAAGGYAALDLTTLPSSMSDGCWVAIHPSSHVSIPTTTAGYYRFKLVWSSMSGTASVAADSGGTEVAFMVGRQDTISTLPTTSYNAYIAGYTITVPVGTTHAAGSYVGTSAAANRNLENAISVGLGGILQWDYANSCTLTCQGSLAINPGGTVTIGTSTNPVAATKLCKLTMAQNGISVSHGIVVKGSASFKVNGQDKGYRIARYVSGTGTTGSPLVVDSVGSNINWAVGDEILVGPGTDSATNYSECEYKFIRTVVSQSALRGTYTLADTAGGAETAGLTYAKNVLTTVCNLQAGAVIITDNNSYGWYLSGYPESATNVSFKWARFETLSGSSTPKTGIYMYSASYDMFSFDHNVVYKALLYGLYFSGNKSVATMTDNVIVKNAASQNGLFLYRCSNKTFTDLVIADGYGSLLAPGECANVTFNNTKLLAGGKSSYTGANAMLYMYSAGTVTFNNLEIDAGRGCAFNMQGFGWVFNNPQFGKAAKCQDNYVSFQAGFTNQCVMYDVNWNTAKTMYDDASRILSGTGTYLALHNMQDTANACMVISDAGFLQSVGTGLTDATYHTAANYALRLDTNNAVAGQGMVFEFKILAKVGQMAQVGAWFKSDSTMSSGTVTMEMWLPGGTSAVASITITHSTSWVPWSLVYNYAAAVNQLIIVKIRAVDAAGYLYIADIWNGTNTITAFNVWDAGRPSPIMFEQLGDALGMWAVPTSSLTVAGSIGALVVAIDAETDALATAVATVDTVVDGIASAVTVVDGIVDEILVDTGTTLDTKIGKISYGLGNPDPLVVEDTINDRVTSIASGVVTLSTEEVARYNNLQSGLSTSYSRLLRSFREILDLLRRT